MVAAKLANMPRGGNREEHHSANLHSASDAADMLNVSEKSVKSARRVARYSEKIAKAVEQGNIPVSLVASIVAESGEEYKLAGECGLIRSENNKFENCRLEI